MQEKDTFGTLIRKLREKADMPIRKVAAFLDLDASTLSKIERDERSANKDQIEKLAKLFKVDERTLLVAYLSDKVTYALMEEGCSEEVLKVAEQKIKYYKSKQSKSKK